MKLYGYEYVTENTVSVVDGDAASDMIVQIYKGVAIVHTLTTFR